MALPSSQQPPLGLARLTRSRRSQPRRLSPGRRRAGENRDSVHHGDSDNPMNEELSLHFFLAGLRQLLNDSAALSEPQSGAGMAQPPKKKSNLERKF